jgi:glucokinase
MSKPTSFALGIDLGGTNLRMGIVDSAGRVADFHSQPLDAALDAEETLRAIDMVAQKFGLIRRAAGIGLGLATSLLPGGIAQPGQSARPALGSVPLHTAVSTELGLPCVIDNDANAALHGEAHFGAARGLQDVLLLTLGTGLGAGLMLGGRIRRGSHSSAAEIGLAQMACPAAPEYVSLETFTSARPLMIELGDPQGDVFAHAAAGEPRAGAFLKDMFEHLGLTITNAHVLLDLELVLFGGGMSRVGEPLINGVREAFERICPCDLQFRLRFASSALGPDHGGVVGAATLWFEEAGILPRL